MANRFLAGDRVRTPHGPGTIVYGRFAPPNFAEPSCYSVRLEGKDHAGTIVSARDVRPLAAELSDQPEQACTCDQCPDGAIECGSAE